MVASSSLCNCPLSGTAAPIPRVLAPLVLAVTDLDRRRAFGVVPAWRWPALRHACSIWRA
eukprot:1146527-Alexandrium_andersonii.AAC.1